MTVLFLCLCEPLTAPHSDERTTADQLPHERQRNRQRGDQEPTRKRHGGERHRIASQSLQNGAGWSNGLLPHKTPSERTSEPHRAISGIHLDPYFGMSSYALPLFAPCSRPIVLPSVYGCYGCRFGVKESDLTEAVTDNVSVSCHPLHSLAMSERSDRFSGDQERLVLCVYASF